ncbi:cache domain-containing sensor histidine kinase [Paenibacillus tepidiphilus]|uniref:cache domain-containing sensor histidine kinase n=1 Tax=Paenibacillus tepidiphilus TaxID=2608683 RepID=UPI0013A52DF4|nr:sensor histidine kinase [Paenibacillus tepidiphilus]
MSKKVSLLLQLISGFSLIIVLIVAFTLIGSYRSSSGAVQSRSNQYLLESVKQLQGKLDAILEEHDRLSSIIVLNPLIQRNLEAAAKGTRPSNSALEVTGLIDEHTRSIDYDIQLKLFSLLDREVYSNTSSFKVLWEREAEIKEAYWYPSISKNKGKMVWFGADVWQNGNIHVLMGARQINAFDTLQPLGTLFLVLPVAVVDNAAGAFRLGPGEKLQIADSFGTIVYSTEPREIGMYMDPGIAGKFGGKEARVIRTGTASRDMFISYSPSAYSGWSVYAYIDAKEAVKDLNAMRRNIVLTGSLGLVAALLFTFFFSWTLSRPIRNLAYKLNKVERGTTLPITGRASNKEMNMLYTSYNSMLHNLDRTIADLSSKQISEKQAQIVALKAQFRPHFLYNTLNTIYWSLAGTRPEEARMVLALSDLLRYSIDRGSEFVTVGQDLQQLERFIYLQKLRYEEKLQIDLQAEPAVLQGLIMKLTLQPLIENAITHGLEPAVREVWLIRIRLYSEAGSLVITVEDNGQGMSRAQMLEALAPGEPPSSELLHTGIGLSNLQQRIRLIYGQHYGLELSASELGGLQVRVTVPLQWTQES